MKTVITMIKCLAVLAAASSFAAQAQLKAYDNFGSRYLHPDRWDFNNAWGVQGVLREIKNGALHGQVRSFAKTDSTGGTQGAGNYVYIDQAKSDIAAWETVSNFDGARVRGCPLSDASDTSGRMRMFSNWFDDANFAGDGDSGKVYSQIQLRRSATDAPGTMSVSFWIFRCDDSGCNTTTDLVTADVDSFLGRAPLGSTVVMGSSWDESTQEMHYWAKLPRQAKIRRTVSLAGAGMQIAPSDTNRRHALHFRTFVADCDRSEISGRFLRPYAIIDGRWQRVRVSATPTRG